MAHDGTCIHALSLDIYTHWPRYFPLNSRYILRKIENCRFYNSLFSLPPANRNEMKFSKHWNSSQNDYFMKLKTKKKITRAKSFSSRSSQLEVVNLIDMQKLNFRVHLVLDLDNFACPTYETGHKSPRKASALVQFIFFPRAFALGVVSEGNLQENCYIAWWYEDKWEMSRKKRVEMKIFSLKILNL